MSKILNIKSNKNTPEVNFDTVSGDFKISGHSFPENARKFYLPVIEWMNGFIPTPGQKLNFSFELFYISSSSIISLLEVVKKIKEYQNTGAEVVVSWYYDEDDDDMKKIADDYMKVVNISFNLIKN